MKAEIETMGGRYFNLADPKPEEVVLEDVATALANQSRFNGFVTESCSIARHAVLTAWLVLKQGHSIDVALAALHHDSHEAYTGDITTPMKRMIGEDRLGPIVDRIDAAIAEAFGINPHLFGDPAIKAADTLALRLEARDVKQSQGAGPHWGWDEPVEPIEGAPNEDKLDAYQAAVLFMGTHRTIVKTIERRND